jgi:cullin-4
MKADLIQFCDYYKEKHKGRKLEWDHALGTMTLRAKFDKEAKELSVSLYQGIVLLMFNQSARLTYTEIREQTRMGKASPAELPG